MTLWMKFPDEAVTDRPFDTAAKTRLEETFTGAPWRDALTLLGLPQTQARMIRWHNDVPYINWTAMTALLSGGTMHPERTKDGDYMMASATTLRGLWRMVKGQWSISQYMHKPLPTEPSLAESIALGLVLQSLLIRLGAHAQNLAGYMASPATAPKAVRKILSDIQAVQMRRTHISSVWNDVLPTGAATPREAPPYFWDGETPAAVTQIPVDTWHGQPVCAGTVTGIALAVTRHTDTAAIAALKTQYNAPVILVFRSATPDTVLLFPQADALAFGTGGVLSHACTVARESNIPAVTATGHALYAAAQESTLWITLDGASGAIEKRQ